jgi:transposase
MCESGYHPDHSRRSNFSHEQNLFLKIYCSGMKNLQKDGWKMITREFKKKFKTSKRPNELKEQYEILEELITNSKLSEEDGEFVVNSRKAGMTFPEIARRLGRNTNTIKNYYYRNEKQGNSEPEQIESVQQNSHHETTEETEITMDNKYQCDFDWLDSTFGSFISFLESHYGSKNFEI